MTCYFRGALLASVQVLLVASPARGASLPAHHISDLPSDITPLAYNLIITPHISTRTFDGDVTIDILVRHATRSMILNSANLAIRSAATIGPKGRIIAKSAATTSALAQTARFTFARPLTVGRHRIRIRYVGKINTHSSGLFELADDRAGHRQTALFTQFENSDARSVFPSWDEPERKARFALQVIVARGQDAISNMPVSSRSPAANGHTRIQFEATPPMSSYLLFFAVGQFERLHRNVEGVDLGVVVRRGLLDQADYALNESAKVLRWYNDYFGTRYPLPKLDNVAGPGQSQTFGAMENWGAIFSFEHSLLLDPKTTTERQKTGIFTTLAHEIAHQWFGDLVTMDWWSDLWLNESFASWMESEATNRFHPEWHRELQSIAYRDQAMEMDSLPSSHAIVQQVRTVEEASQAFDPITYFKGMSIIEMFQSAVGNKAWRASVRNYVAQHSYANASSEDFWRSVAPHAGKRFLEAAHDFTMQPGVPLIRLAHQCRDQRQIVSLEQGEFRRAKDHDRDRHWLVPVVLRTAAGAEARVLLDGRAEVSLPDCSPVFANADQKGYYRTSYTADAFAALASVFDTLPPAEQLGLLNDSYALGMAELQPLSDTLSLLQQLPPHSPAQLTEKALTIWSSLLALVNGDPLLRTRLSRFGEALFAPLLERAGWRPRAGEQPGVESLRSALIEKLGGADIAAVAEKARALVETEYSGGTRVDPTIRRAIFHVAALSADQVTWDRLHTLARRASSQQERDMLYTALGLARDPALADQALSLSLTAEPASSIGPNMIEAVAIRHPAKAISFAVAHRDQVARELDSLSLPAFVPGLADGSRDPDALVVLQDYRLRLVKEGASTRAIDTAIADLGSNIVSQRSAESAIRSFFNERAEQTTAFGNDNVDHH